MKKLNLGCGRDIKKTFINVDKIKVEGVDLVLHVGKERFPYEDNSVDYVYASHFIEHLDTDETDFMLDELYRICKPHAVILFIAPHYLSPTSCRPWHKQRISETYLADYEMTDTVCSFDHKSYFKIESWIEYQGGFPEAVYLKLEVVK